jgi:Fuc2NAc and GlcNAc transferase
MVVAFFAIAAFTLSLLFTLFIERRSRALGLIKAPNERSSHVVPTPLGGGIGLATASVGACLVLAWLQPSPYLALAFLTAVMATLGFVDDLRDLSPEMRFGIQGIVLVLLVAMIPALPHIPIAGMFIGGTLLATLVVIAGLWWINLFNFMDGIDGIAGSQAVVILLGAAVAWLVQDLRALDDSLFWLIGAVVGAAVGLLVRNWPPAKIFMGDAGSNGLALIIFAIAAISIAKGELSYASWLTLVSVFLVDATITLVRRGARGELPWRAHRRHAYQQLARCWGHRVVTLIYSGISLIWAIPLAVATALLPQYQWGLVLVAIIPLGILALLAGAGDAEERWT